MDRTSANTAMTAETIKCFHCPSRVRVVEAENGARIEPHNLYSGKPCVGPKYPIKGNWRDDPTYQSGKADGASPA